MNGTNRKVTYTQKTIANVNLHKPSDSISTAKQQVPTGGCVVCSIKAKPIQTRLVLPAKLSSIVSSVLLPLSTCIPLLPNRKLSIFPKQFDRLNVSAIPL